MGHLIREFTLEHSQQDEFIQEKSETEQRRAEAILKGRAERKADAPKATEDYQKARQTTLDRTKRLREERLDREKKVDN
jgi:hypothetical protein